MSAPAPAAVLYLAKVMRHCLQAALALLMLPCLLKIARQPGCLLSVAERRSCLGCLQAYPTCTLGRLAQVRVLLQLQAESFSCMSFSARPGRACKLSLESSADWGLQKLSASQDVLLQTGQPNQPR